MDLASHDPVLSFLQFHLRQKCLLCKEESEQQKPFKFQCCVWHSIRLLSGLFRQSKQQQAQRSEATGYKMAKIRFEPRLDAKACVPPPQHTALRVGILALQGGVLTDNGGKLPFHPASTVKSH